MGAEDLRDIASHSMVEVTALCDVDARNLAAAQKIYPNARVYADYRKLFDEAPVALWEEDFSRVADYLDVLRTDGVRDLADHFERFPASLDQAILETLKHVGL